MNAAIQRLFVGIALPLPIQQQLTKLCPASTRRLRPVAAEQMHITLRFIGNAETDAVADVLSQINGRAFDVSFTGFGRFGAVTKGGVLWIGVEVHPLLIALRDQVCDAISRLGIAPRPRAFTPHVTLARFRRGVDARMVDAFLNQTPARLPTFSVSEFLLYSSASGAGGSVYTPERAYALRGTK